MSGSVYGVGLYALLALVILVVTFSRLETGARHQTRAQYPTNGFTDGAWTYIGKSGGIKSYVRKVEGSDLLAFRGVAYLDMHISQAMGPFMNISTSYEWVNMLKHIETLPVNPTDSSHEGHRREDIVYQVLNLPWPVSPRDVLLHRKFHFASEKGVVSIHYKSTDDERVPLVPGTIRAHSPHSLWRFRSLRQCNAVDKSTASLVTRPQAPVSTSRYPSWTKRVFRSVLGDDRATMELSVQFRRTLPPANSRPSSGQRVRMVQTGLSPTVITSPRNDSRPVAWWRKVVSAWRRLKETFRGPPTSVTADAQATGVTGASRELAGMQCDANDWDLTPPNGSRGAGTVVEFESFVDSKGSIPAWFINYMQRSFPAQALAAYRKLAETNTVAPFMVVHDCLAGSLMISDSTTREPYNMKSLIYNATVWKWGADPMDIKEKKQLGGVQHNAFVTTLGGVVQHVSESGEQPPPLDDFDSVINANGGLILPGLMDSHIHVGMFGESQYYVDLADCMSIEELQLKVAGHLAKFPDLPWVTGVNWDQTKLGRYPTKHDLSAIATTKPIFLYRVCWHIGVANEAALQLAGIFDSPDHERQQSPPGGVIEVDDAGEPTGILKERAVELISAAQQRLNNNNTGTGSVSALQQKKKFLQEGMNVCVRAGLTTVQTNELDSNALRALRELQANNELPLRAFLTPVHDELARDPTLQPFRPVCFQAGTRELSIDVNAASMDSRLLMERVKIFSDGSLGAETAALRDFAAKEVSAQQKQEGKGGVLVYERSVLAEMVAAAYRAGFRVEIHAIGDAAAEQVLDALDDLERILRDGDQSAVVFCGRADSAQRLRHWRPILTHCQVLGADLIERMAAKGVVANVQPPFVPTDMAWVNNRIKGAQLEHSYVWKSLLLHASRHPENNPDDVLRVAGGSDAPVEGPNPFTGIYDAMRRTNKRRLKADKEQEEMVFKPEECLTFDQALWIYTIGGAYAAGVEDKLGQIAPGYFADLVLVDPAILEDPEVLHNLLPDVVIVGGAISAVNHVAGSEASAGSRPLPLIETCSQALPYLPPLTASVPAVATLSEATFTPGRGGRPGGRAQRPTAPVLCFPSGLKCACLLSGKFCPAC